MSQDVAQRLHDEDRATAARHSGGGLRMAGRFAGNLSVLEDVADSLWENGYSSKIGMNHRLPLALARSMSDSLRLIKVEQLTLRVCAPGEAFGDSRKREGFARPAPLSATLPANSCGPRRDEIHIDVAASVATSHASPIIKIRSPSPTHVPG